MPTTAPQTRHAVTAIIVAHDGARLLPGAVRAVGAQTHPVDQVVGVDTGSLDRGAAVLAELLGPDAVVAAERTAGFGDAVAAGVRHAAGRRAGPSDPRQVEWIWLLHDDCEPAPEALERLLRAAGRNRAVAVLGPKVLDGQDRRTLREVGISIDRAGRRVTGIDPGEIDQGQHDHKQDVLAVGSAGMLVRRDVWDQLGGFDSRLGFFRDDLDFCWRVQGAGHRVQVVTDAVLYHRELAGRRRRPTEGGRQRRLDRRNALWVLAVSLPLLTMLRVVGGCVVGSLARGGYFLLAKQLDQSAAQALALAGLFGHPVQLARARRRRARGRREAYNAARLYLPPARTLSRLAEKISGLLSDGPPQASGGLHQAVSEDQEDEQFIDAPSVARRFFGSPGVQLFAALLIVALVAERRLLGLGPLGGGALVPAWGGAGALWREYLAGFHAVGVGSTTSAPPYLAVVAGLATVLGGQAWLAVDVLLLGCVPLAGLTAYLAARRLVTATAARLLLAASYALLPVATGSVAAGRLGTAVAFALLPLIAIGVGRMLTAAPRQARRAAWAVGLLTGLAAAFAPLAWVFGLLLAVFVLVLFAARRWLPAAARPLAAWPAADPLNAAVVAVVPFLVLFPWSLHLLSQPSALIAEAGGPVTGLIAAGSGPGPAALLALSPGGPGLPPAWVTAGLGLAVLAALLPHRGRGLTVAGWIVAGAGWLTAAVVRSLASTPPGGSAAVPGWPGCALALTALGLLLASAPAAQWLAEAVKTSPLIPNGPGRLPDAAPEPPAPEPSTPEPPAPGPPASGPRTGHGLPVRMLAGVTLLAAASAPLLVASYWVTTGVRGPITKIAAPVLPAFVSASSGSGNQYRTLILRPDGAGPAGGDGTGTGSGSVGTGAGGGGLDYMVVRQGDPTLGEPELAGAPAAARVLSAEVAALGAPDGADAGDPGLLLGQFGIRWVLLPGPVDPVLAQRLDGAIGLVALSKAPAYDLWQVSGPVARVRVVASDGSTTTLNSGPVDMSGVSAPAAGGTLLLAEPYGGWTATLNGSALRPLAQPVDGWAQGFVLPPGGGRLSITRNNLARDLSLLAELLAVLVVGVLALPGKRADPAEQTQALAVIREARPEQEPAGVGTPGASGASGASAVADTAAGLPSADAGFPGMDAGATDGGVGPGSAGTGTDTGTAGPDTGMGTGDWELDGAGPGTSPGDWALDGAGTAAGTPGGMGPGADPSDWDFDGAGAGTGGWALDRAGTGAGASDWVLDGLAAEVAAADDGEAAVGWRGRAPWAAGPEPHALEEPGSPFLPQHDGQAAFATVGDPASRDPASYDSAAAPASGRRQDDTAPAHTAPADGAARAAKPERHSHRAAKHGRPSRWRGGRSGRNGES